MNSLAKKLNIKDQNTLLIDQLPPDLKHLKNELTIETGIEVVLEINSTLPIEWCLLFVQKKNDIKILFDRVRVHMEGDAMLWFAYPKKSSKKYKSDITRDEGWELIGQHGWEPVRMVAIDEDWSAFRFRKVEFIKNITRNAEMALTTEAKTRTTQKNKK